MSHMGSITWITTSVLLSGLLCKLLLSLVGECAVVTLTHQYKTAEAEDLRELIAHAVLEVFGLHLCHRTTRKIKYLLTVIEWGRKCV